MDEEFEKQGYRVYKNILNSSELEFFKNALDNVSSNDKRGRKTWPNGVVDNPDFWDIITNQAILNKVHDIIGSDAKFLQHNDLHRNFSSSGWHRDSADRIYGKGQDWDTSEPYKLLRVGLYLQDGKENKFRLGVIPKSHTKSGGILEKSGLLPTILRAIEKRVNSILNWDFKFPFFGRCIYTVLEKGDMIIFDPRLYHRGTEAPNPKYSIFIGYGIENKHFLRHTKYYLEERPDLEYTKLPNELREKLGNKNLLSQTY